MKIKYLLLTLATLSYASPALAARIDVSTAEELRTAMGAALAGDEIHLAPGVYAFTRQLRTQNDGSPGAPIRIIGDDVSQTRLDFVSVEGLVFYNSDWELINVWVNGACQGNERCEAGIGVKQGAFRFLMRGCRISNWIQHLKSARDPVSEVEDASVLANEFYNDRPIDGTPIDVVGGKRWHIADNYLHDYGGNGISYGIFIKGSTSDSIIERNLVIGAHDRPTTGTIVGISLGGGGTGAQFCPDGDCARNCEDRRSIVRNNIVAHCTDACFHTKRSCDGAFLNNLGTDCGIGLQIQINGTEGPVRIENNLLDGRITGGDNRSESQNLLRVGPMLSDIYSDPSGYDFSVGADPSAALGQGTDILGDVPADYCSSPRTSPLDLGPFVLGAGCAVMPWSAATNPSDAGQPIVDGGTSSDAGVGLDATGGVDAEPVQPDAGVVNRPDAGSGVPGERIDDSGCTCVVAEQPRFWFPLLGAVLLWVRRRR